MQIYAGIASVRLSSSSFIFVIVVNIIKPTKISAEAVANEGIETNTGASSIETSENAPRRLIDSYKYQPLKVAGYNESVLIPTENNNRSVYIRLNDDDPYEAEIKVDGNYMYESITKTIPVRNNAKHTSFNFSINSPDSIPKSDDDDVSYSGSGNDNTWYVCMFAVAVGHDASYVQTYSNVLYLGSVTINVK